MFTLDKIILIDNLSHIIVKYSNIFKNIFNNGKPIGITKAIRLNGNIIKDTNGIKRRLNIGDNKFILLKLFIRIGILAINATTLV